MSPEPPITLIATIGSSPAILTETLYALYKNREGPIKEIDIITTTHGLERINTQLLNYDPQTGKNGGFYQFCECYGIPPHSIKLPDEADMLVYKEGKPLDDIKSTEDDRFVAETIQERVRYHCNQPNRQVIAVLAGGRKTMGTHLAAAMLLFANRNDRLVHILVDEPYDQIPEFYFPEQVQQQISLKNRQGEVLKKYEAQAAQINLIDIPFVKLRTYLENQLNFQLSFGELQQEVNNKLRQLGDHPVKSMQVDLEECGIYVNGRENAISLEPRELSILALFAQLNEIRGKVHDITWNMVVKDQKHLDLLHLIYRAIVLDPKLASYEYEEKLDEYEEFEKEDLWVDQEFWNRPNNTNKFSKVRSTLRKKLESGLGEHHLSIDVDDILTYEKRPRNVSMGINRFEVPPAHVSIEGLPQEELQNYLSGLS